MNIDELIRESLQKESQNIQLPPGLYDKIADKAMRGTKEKPREKRWFLLRYSLLKYSTALALGMVISFVIMTAFKPGTKLGKGSMDTDIASTVESSMKEFILLSNNLGYADSNFSAISKLYPGYIPEDMKLGSRMLFENENRVELFFSSTSSNGMHRNMSITILGYNPKINNLEYGEEVSMDKGNGYLQAIYTKDKQKIKLGRLIYKLKDDLSVILDASYMSKSEIIDVINSLEITDIELPDNTVDPDIMDMVGEKIMNLVKEKNSPPSVEEVVKLLEGMNLKYKILGDKQRYNGFTVQKKAVIIFTEGSSTLDIYP